MGGGVGLCVTTFFSPCRPAVIQVCGIDDAAGRWLPHLPARCCPATPGTQLALCCSCLTLPQCSAQGIVHLERERCSVSGVCVCVGCVAADMPCMPAAGNL